MSFILAVRIYILAPTGAPGKALKLMPDYIHGITFSDRLLQFRNEEGADPCRLHCEASLKAEEVRISVAKVCNMNMTSRRFYSHS